MSDLKKRLAELARRRQAMTIDEFIADVERAHFRTGHDTGANSNALMIWNMVREHAGMERLTRDDLIARHAESNGVSVEEMRLDYQKMQDLKILRLNNPELTYAEAFDIIDASYAKDK